MSLSVVFSPLGTASSPAVDIVAVHGLGGDTFATWTHPESKKFWLRDFLPQQIPDARIMTFGYNADAAFGHLLASLVDKREEPQEMQRPLVFIAHSLGGIVVKQALFQARLEARYQTIKDATVGLIFMGTPHRGSDKAAYGKVLSNAAQFLSHRPPQRLLTALQTNSDVLLRLTTDFRFQLPDYEVYSFFEQRPLKGHSSLIVEKHSALLETNHEEQIPVDADHRAMCRFATDQDVTYERVYKRVKRMKLRPRHLVNEQSGSFQGRQADYPDTSMPMRNLAICPEEAGRREEALLLAQELVTLRKMTLGADHPDTLRSMGDLAAQYSDVGRREEALLLAKEVVALRKMIFGADHPDTLRSMGDLAVLLRCGTTR
ncbi:hypothetical protein AYL99_12136 [Fonsecaea erecta]|uniref:DUF676 domain-containing protein n=1 Tax=Fonsecaea erecta TaxID=1367422 RepID=A0A178Z2Q6_9EURO|nr:hypothetical protein AYL99_12136 [Fonsecaea erecta]OAP53696.1 hypothetical protein AYL99_12136 [Fonsecaea erecta]